MTTWLLASLVLHAVYVLTPAALYLPAEGTMTHLGGRDEQPKPSRMVGRARRALANWQENFPVFLALALGAMALGRPDAGAGAVLFLVARVAYLPLYLTGIPGLRSLSWMVSVAGLVWMAVSLA